MNMVIQNVVFPQRISDFPLYFRDDQGGVIYKKNQISFYNELSFDSYFNSFFINFWLGHTKVRELTYRLNLKGDIKIQLFFSKRGHRPKLEVEKILKNALKEKVVSLKFRLKNSHKNGRFYLKLKCIGDRAFLYRGEITSAQKTRPVHLGIIVCTYRKEKYALNILNILVELFKKSKNFSFYIIDNGSSLPKEKGVEPEGFSLKIIPNKNLGGSGGFSRGMYEICQRQEEKITHFLLLDDDIDLDPEIIFRTIAFFCFADTNLAIAGNIIDYFSRSHLIEAGCHYDFNQMRPKNHLRNADLNMHSTLDRLSIEYDTDYAGWYFFGLPKNILDKTGLGFPMFIRGDDIEFGFRLAQYNIKTIVTPGIGVWHESSYKKNTHWLRYYNFRNALINIHLYKEKFMPQNIVRLFQFTIGFILLYDYYVPTLVLKAIEDFLKGPDFLKTIDAERNQELILALQKTFYKTDAEIKQIPPSRQGPEQDSLLKKFVFIITLNGHLLPMARIKHQVAEYYYDNEFIETPIKAALSIFGCRYCKEVNEETGLCIIKEISPRKAVSLILKFIVLSVKLIFRSKSLRKQWRNEHKELCSIEFWEKQFINNSS